MYDVFKSRISAGGYKLADIQYRIKKLYAEGDLTEDQTDELMAMASAGVSVDAERPATLEMLQSLADRIAAVEALLKASAGGNDEGNTDGGDAENYAYPVWKPWDGISKDYQYGAIVFHIDGLWLSTCKGQNVWEPGAPGIENFWVRYEAPESAENTKED